jgi:hypothetical protein
MDMKEMDEPIKMVNNIKMVARTKADHPPHQKIRQPMEKEFGIRMAIDKERLVLI